jgi:glycerophosphoryl diester phosphodiesterase
MAATPSAHSLLSDTLKRFRSSWKALALTDLAFKLVAFIILTPLVGILFRIFVATSGRSVLSDIDILLFFLGPIGWICGILVAAIWLAIVALEQAALMGVIYAETTDRRLTVLGSLRFAGFHAWSVLQVTARIVVFTLVTIAPFLAIAAVTYFSLLTQYDINYYLKERPLIFNVVLGIGGVLAVACTAVLLRLFTGWFFSLPLILFDDVNPANALRRSSEMSRGRRRTIMSWIVGWAAANVVVSGLATAAVAAMGRLLVSGQASSLRWLAVAIGITVLSWAVVSVIINLFGTTTFATILFSLYRHMRAETLPDSHLAIVEQMNDTSKLRLTRTRLAMIGVIGLLTAVAVGFFAVHTVQLKDDVLIMAHRGASKTAPENTMAAIRQAINDQADWVEIDVQETADGEVVVFHDSDFMRVADNNLKIWDATMDDLQDIDIGSWFAPEFKDQRVPTLNEVLAECKGKIGVNIELKYYGHDQRLEQRVAEIIEDHEMSSDIMLMSLKMDGVLKMKSIRPGWKVGLLMSVSAGDLKKLEANFLAVNAGFAGRNLIRSAHNNDKQVFVWTVNDAPNMSIMMNRGVDGLLTDKPALARAVLEQRAEMNTPERLLLELAGLLGTVPEVVEQ